MQEDKRGWPVTSRPVAVSDLQSPPIWFPAFASSCWPASRVEIQSGELNQNSTLQAYQSVFAGACGHTYGHHDIWPFDPPGLEYAKPWREALTAPGRMQMRYLRQLMKSQSQAGRVSLSKFVAPRDTKTAAPLLLTDRIAATLSVDGSWAFVYTPRGASFSVDLASLNGQQVTAQWFDPRSGKLQSLGTLDRNSREAFDPPGEPGPRNDWILTLTCPRP